MFSRLLQDIKYGARALRHAPVFSATVVLTLGLAIAAATAVFSLIDAALLKSLPYRDPDRLVHIYQAIPKAIPFPVGFSPPDFLALRERVSFLPHDNEISRTMAPRCAGASPLPSPPWCSSDGLRARGPTPRRRASTSRRSARRN